MKNSFEFKDSLRYVKLSGSTPVGFNPLVRLLIMIEVVRLVILGYIGSVIISQQANWAHIILGALILAGYLIDIPTMYKQFMSSEDSTKKYVSKYQLSKWAQAFISGKEAEELHIANSSSVRYITPFWIIMLYLPFFRIISPIWGRILPNFFNKRQGLAYVRSSSKEKGSGIYAEYALILNPYRMKATAEERSIFEIAMALECAQLDRQVLHAQQLENYKNPLYTITPDNEPLAFNQAASLCYFNTDQIPNDPDSVAEYLIAASVADSIGYALFQLGQKYAFNDLRRAIEMLIFKPMETQTNPDTYIITMRTVLVYKVFALFEQKMAKGDVVFDNWETFRTKHLKDILYNNLIVNAINEYPRNLRSLDSVNRYN